MPVVLRSQARSVQSTDLVSSPGANTPRLSYDSRQGNAVVTNSIYEGAPYEEVANENLTESSTTDFNIKKCGSGKCMTCNDLVTSKIYYSNHSTRTYNVINHDGEDLSCNSANLVYLRTCRGCGVQYVGETVQPLRVRMNQHRSNKSGCSHLIEHKNKTCPGGSFSVQIIVKLDGNGRNDFGEMDEEIYAERLRFEDCAMKNLRTIYPYGLNEKAKNKVTGMESSMSIGSLFPPFPRKGIFYRRERKNRNSRTVTSTKEHFFNLVESWIITDI